PAEGAGGVLDHVQFHHLSRQMTNAEWQNDEGRGDRVFRHSAFVILSFSWDASGPDGGTTKLHPSARPRQLPRMRRGMYRPASTSCHAATSAPAGCSAAAC